MKCLRIYATPDGESHFGEIELPTTKRSVHPDAAPFDVTASYLASRVRLTHIPAGMREVAWHTVPEPVLTVRLNGSVEYETSDRDVRYVQAGSFVLVKTRTARDICHATLHNRKRSFGYHFRTDSICRRCSRFGTLPHLKKRLASRLIEMRGDTIDGSAVE